MEWTILLGEGGRGGWLGVAGSGGDGGAGAQGVGVCLKAGGMGCLPGVLEIIKVLNSPPQKEID